MKIANSELIVKESSESLEKTKAELIKTDEDKSMEDILKSENTRRNDRRGSGKNNKNGSKKTE